VTSVVTTLAGGCAARTAPRAALPPELTWLGEFTRPTGAAFPALGSTDRFGSISGLAHDAASNQWIAVIDDREDSRIAWLSIALTGNGLEVSPVRMQRLRAGAGVPDRVATQADLEGITVLPDGTLVMSEEGHERDGEVWQPALLLVSGQGVVTAVVDFPPAYQIESGTSGLRPNQGIESVTRLPDGRLIAGLEQPLIQDGEVTFDHGAPGRLIEFVPSGATFRAGREWTYQLSPTPRIKDFAALCSDGENGLVDLVALSTTRLVALERACVMEPPAAGDAEPRAMNPVSLYLVDLTTNPVTKTLLLDLATIVERLTPALSRLENFEGLAFGPMVNQSRSLLLVSDDNFRQSQKTSFLLFGLR
jgi:hypothetical protein